MKVQEFSSLSSEFFEELSKEVPLFEKNMINHPGLLKDKDMPFIKWVQTFLDWAEVTSDMAQEYWGGYDHED